MEVIEQVIYWVCGKQREGGIMTQLERRGWFSKSLHPKREEVGIHACI